MISSLKIAKYWTQSGPLSGGDRETDGARACEVVRGYWLAESRQSFHVLLKNRRHLWNVAGSQQSRIDSLSGWFDEESIEDWGYLKGGLMARGTIDMTGEL